MTAALRQEWQQAGADAASRQREFCDALAPAAQRISEQTQAQASGTLAEINRLVDAAADAPGPPSPCKASWPRATASAWTPGAARWPRWSPRCARNGSRPAPTPPAASATCDALLLAAQDISERRAQASGTLAEINRLVDAAAEAPKAAVALQAELGPATRPA